MEDNMAKDNPSQAPDTQVPAASPAEDKAAARREYVAQSRASAVLNDDPRSFGEWLPHFRDVVRGDELRGLLINMAEVQLTLAGSLYIAGALPRKEFDRVTALIQSYALTNPIAIEAERVRLARLDKMYPDRRKPAQEEPAAEAPTEEPKEGDAGINSPEPDSTSLSDQQQ